MILFDTKPCELAAAGCCLLLLLAAAASIKRAAIIAILFDAEPRKCAAATDLLEVYYCNPVDKLSWRMNVLLLRLLPILSKGLLLQSS